MLVARSERNVLTTAVERDVSFKLARMARGRGRYPPVEMASPVRVRP